MTGRFNLQIPPAQMDRLRDIATREKAAGRATAMDAVLKELDYRLTCEADEWGESRDYLPVIDFQLRFGVVGPVGVWFGVSEARRIVFVRRFRTRGEP